MKNKRVPVGMITSPYNAYNHPNSVINYTDNSQAPIPQISSENYGVFQPIFARKGVTDELINIEGTDILNNYVKMFGLPAANSYGPMGNYAYEAVRSGFRLGVINMRPADATYPNTYLAFNIEKAFDTDGTTALTKDLYICLDSTTNNYFMSFDEDEVKANVAAGETINTIPLEYFNFGYQNHTIEKVTTKTDFKNYMKNQATVESVLPGNTIDASKVHVPLFGLAYRGRGDFGNGFVANINIMSDKINNPNYNTSYNHFDCNIVYGGETEHEFSFTLFDLGRNKINYGFRFRAQKACVMQFTNTNSTPTFASYSIERKEANKVEKLVKDICTKVQNYVLAEIKTIYPAFDPATVDSNWEDITDAIKFVSDSYSRNKTTQAGKDSETPFSYINPWAAMESSMANYMPFNIEVAPSKLVFSEGTLGQLADVLSENDFDWDSEITEPVFDPVTGTFVDTPYKVWERMLINVFDGTTDDAIWDQSILRDSIIFGEGYPDNVQEQIDTFCYYKEDVVNAEHTRIDMCYIRTPKWSVNTINKAYDWQESFLNPKGKNMNMHPVIGTFEYTESTTGAIQRFSGFYDYLGSSGALFNYLTTGTSDPFAAGDHSVVMNAEINSQEMIPRTSVEREELNARNIMYYTRRSTGYYALGDDSAYNIGMTSLMKNVGSNIHFNRILNIASLIMKDNIIILPSAENLARLKNKIETAIASETRHFQDQVIVSLGISPLAQELNKPVVLCEIAITGNEFARHNRLHMIVNRPSTSATA